MQGKDSLGHLTVVPRQVHRNWPTRLRTGGRAGLEDKRTDSLMSAKACWQQLMLSISGYLSLGGICSGYSFWRHFHCLRKQECPEDTDDTCRFWTGRIC